MYASFGCLNLSDKKINWLILYQGDSYNVFSLPELLHINQIFYILDEPTVGLDTESSDRFLSYLKDESNKGKTIIISSHDINLIERFWKKVLFF